MDITYTLGRTDGSDLQQLACAKDSPAIVRTLVIHPENDCLDFHKQVDAKTTFGSYWSIDDLGVFRELFNYTRLMDLAAKDVGKLAGRMHELLYGRREPKYTVAPRINPKNPRLRQIVNELMTLHALEKKLVDEGAILLPEMQRKG